MGLADRPPEQWAAVIDPLPPAADEAIDVSTTQVRTWLTAGHDDPTEGDLDTHPQPEPPAAVPATKVGAFRVRDEHGQPLVLAYLGHGDTQILPAWRIRPAMTIVVPAEYGGCDPYGWHPTNPQPVLDLADLAHHRPTPHTPTGATQPTRHPGGRAVLRIGPSLHTLAEAVAGDASDRDAFRQAVAALRELAAPDQTGEHTTNPDEYRPLLNPIRHALPQQGDPLADLLDTLTAPRLRVTPWPPAPGHTGGADPHRPWDILLATGGAGLADDDTEAGSSTTGTPIGLTAHQQAVADRAARYAGNLHLPDHLITAVKTAALLHDEGKRDPRFQTMLHRGDALEAELADEPLAKSGMDPTDRTAYTRARTRAGYPHRGRHEELSARIAAHHLHADHPDRDLIVHLVAAHHGHHRPLLPPVVDPRPPTVHLDGHGIDLPAHAGVDLDAVDRYHALHATYGYWGLALLETIVRHADHTASRRNEGA